MISALMIRLVVVSIQSRKLHPVASFVRIIGIGDCVSCVSAEPRHAETEIVGLRSHRKRRILARVPQAGVFLDLKRV